METTNRDVREILLGKQQSINLDLEQQNTIIDNLPDEQIVEALGQCNGYGKRFIKYLSEKGLLTKERINAIRQAIKYVGVGTGVAAGVEEVNQYAL